MNSARLAHWQNVYKEKAENQVGWFQETPAISLEMIEAVHPKFDSAIVNIGGCVGRCLSLPSPPPFHQYETLPLIR